MKGQTVSSFDGGGRSRSPSAARSGCSSDIAARSARRLWRGSATGAPRSAAPSILPARRPFYIQQQTVLPRREIMKNVLKF